MNRLLFALCCLVLAAPLAAQPASGGAPSEALERFRVPADAVTFIENRGQWPDEVAFLARLEGVDLWITATGLTYDYHTSAAANPGAGREGRVLRARFVGGQAASVEGRAPRAGYHHYLRGNDSARWATFVRLYEEVVLRNVYEGVSLRLRAADGLLEQAWLLTPPADAEVVRIDVEGADGLGATEGTVYDRATVLGLPDRLAEASPTAAAALAESGLRDGTRVRYARYLGGFFGERLRVLAVDDDGAVYLGGRTSSFNFPTPDGFDTNYGGSNDAFVAKLNASGTQSYGTFLGGGSGDEARGLAYANESVYVTGVTSSFSFPTTPGAYDEDGSGQGDTDAFVSRLRTDGSGLVFSTYLSGSGDEEDDDVADDVLGGGADDAGAAVAVTATGAVVVAGRTFSDDFPVPNGSYAGEGDGFVVVLNADGSDVQGGTYFGGNELDEARALVLDGQSAYVAGETNSDDFEGLNGAFGGGVDAFVVRILGTAATVVGGTYIGGGGLEGASGTSPNERTGAIDLAVDEDGILYVSGDTSSDDFAAAATFGPLGGTDAFVARLSPQAAGVAQATIFGGSGTDRARGVAIAPDGTIHLVGDTSSGDFPTQDAEDDSYGGQGDAFVFQLSGEGPDLRYGSYLGGSDADAAYDLAVGADGFTYLAGETQSGSDFPVTAVSPGYGFGGDAFAASFDLAINNPPEVASPLPDTTLDLDGPPFTADLATVFSDPEDDPLSFECASSNPDVADVGDCSDGTITVTAVSVGTATVTVTASDGSGSASEAFVVTVTDNLPPEVVAPPDDATLVLNDPPLEVALPAVFDDPEGDALSFGCTSSDPEVASVGDCGEGTLTVTAESVGAATITATATDGNNPSVSVDFLVTVETDDPPPVVVSPIDDLALALGDAPFTVDLDTVFEDPDGGDLTFTCASDTPTVAPVSGCADGTLTVAPAMEGTATVTVTATDPAGAATSDAFAVEVVNPPPVVALPIPDRALLLGGAPYEVDLDTVFADPNGDALAYSFGVDASAVLLALDGSVLIVTPNALGAATVTVTASDGSGSASEAFVVTVTDNLPPEVVAPPDDATLTVGDDPLVLDLALVFSDAEGDNLNYACESSAPGVASVGNCFGGTLSVAPLSAGEATITVTATDPFNPPVSTTFLVAVVTGNAPPFVAAPIDDASLDVSGAPLVVDLALVFEDPNGDALTFACTSSEPGVASADGCVEGMLTVTPLEEGGTTVTVTATDPVGASAEDAFAVTVGCASVAIDSVTPSPANPEAGTEVLVTAVVQGADAATLRYRASGGGAFESAAMVRSGGSFVATIPGSVVTARGVEYAVEARGACGSVQRAGAALRVRVPAGVASPALPAATAQSGYRLVSVPLDLDDDEAAAVLDEFGAADDEAWRLFELLPPGETGDRRAAGTDDQWYRDDPSSITVVPGQAYWLIVRDGGPFNTGAGTTLPSGEEFEMELHRGWNLVGTPFGYEVPLERARTESGAPLQLQAYDGAWSNVADSLRPFQGYAFRLDDDDRLVIEPPPLDGSARPVVARGGEKKGGSHDGPGWAVDITATLGSVRDDNNTAQVAPGASDARDAHDWYEPPPIGEYVSVAFAPPGVAAPLTVDARPVTEEGASWPVLVRSSGEGRIDLRFAGLDSVPDGFVAWLVDDVAGTVRDLHRDPAYTVVSHGAGSSAQLRLVIGTEAYVQATSGFDGTTPTNFHLAPSYPNPFRTAATLQYALPSDEHVVIEVFDITGRRVATLVDEVVEAGYHTVVWDRRSGGRSDLASGVYLYRMRAGSFTATQRAVLVR